MSPQEGLVDDEDETNDESRPLDFEAGHGTFIAGIVQQICPDADVQHRAACCRASATATYTTWSAPSSGAGVGAVGRGRHRGDELRREHGRRPAGELFGVAELHRLLGGGLVRRRGRQPGTWRPYFPAALPERGSASAGLAADGKAWFTNFGGWVDACAPAINVVSTFFNDFDETLHVRNSSGTVTPTVTAGYRGWARWSGTSFAAPKVATLIAQEMYLNGDPWPDARDAWDRAHLVPPLPLPGPRHRLQRLTARGRPPPIGVLKRSQVPSTTRGRTGTPIPSTHGSDHVYRKGVLEAEDFPVAEVSEHLDEPDTVVWVDFCGPSKERAARARRRARPARARGRGRARARTSARSSTTTTTHLFLVVPRGGLDVERGELDESEIDAFIGHRWLVTVRKDERLRHRTTVLASAGTARPTSPSTGSASCSTGCSTSWSTATSTRSSASTSSTTRSARASSPRRRSTAVGAAALVRDAPGAGPVPPPGRARCARRSAA